MTFPSFGHNYAADLLNNYDCMKLHNITNINITQLSKR